MRIGIDIDGVLYPWADAANAAVVAQFGVPDPGPHQHWEWLKEQVTQEQWHWLWTDEGQAAAFGDLGLTYPGVVEAFLTFLKDPRHRCHFVTHRDPRRSGARTAAYLARHFGAHPWAGTHVLQNGTPKWKLMDWDVFIDDKVETALDMLEHTRAQVFVPARPWNEELTWCESRGWNGTRRLIRYDDPAVVAEWVARHG